MRAGAYIPRSFFQRAPWPSAGFSASQENTALGAAGRRWALCEDIEVKVMKVVNSIKSMKVRDKNCRVIRRKGRTYVINKKNPRFKARQG